MAKYTLWEAVNLALSAGTKALTEVRQLARTPPPPGKDGLGFDDLTMSYDGERTLAFVFQRGKDKKEFEFKLPMMLDAGTHRDGKAYERGDAVSYGGSLWIAQRDTADKPESSDAWRLAVKRGRDSRKAPGDA